MLRVRRSGPRFAFRRPWSRRPAAMQLASAPTFNGRVLAWRAFAGFSEAPLARPMRPKTRCMAGFSKWAVPYLLSADYTETSGIDDGVTGSQNERLREALDDVAECRGLITRKIQRDGFFRRD